MKRVEGMLACLAAVASSCGGIVSPEGSAPAIDAGSSPDTGVAIDAGTTAPPDAGAVDSGICSPPGTVCAGVCVDTQTSLANCGSCGTACAGTCAGGRCIEELSTSGGAGPIALDSSRVYWSARVNYGDEPILAVPIDGGATTTLASVPGGALGLAVDS